MIHSIDLNDDNNTRFLYLSMGSPNYGSILGRVTDETRHFDSTSSHLIVIVEAARVKRQLWQKNPAVFTPSESSPETLFLCRVYGARINKSGLG